MARFNSAKMNLAAEVSGITAFERKYNALIDLLDQGYTVESLMNDHHVRVTVNPQDGIKITTDSENVFSIDPLTGEIVIGKYDSSVASLIASLGDMAYEDAVEAAKLGSTVIDGGYIKTGLIDASRIDTGTLNAARVAIGSTSTYSAGYNPSQKRRVFTATPTTPYDVGDLWSGGPTGDLKKCKKARASGAYVASDWELASKYTDDSSVAGLIASLGDMAYEDAVEASKLGSTVIDGGYIKTGLIDASRIDTGTLNAARIAASSITFDKLASATVTSITDTIDLGGRNLLKNSDKDVTNSNYSLTSYTWANVSDMVQGEQYTITIEGTLPAGLSWYINVYAQNPTEYPALATLTDSDKVSANKWVKTVTMPPLASGQTFTGATSLYQFPIGGGQTVSVTRIKIEKGNKATDWTPAPEDVDADITTAQTTADTAQTTANSKTTTFYQTAAPSTVGRTTGDVWFDSDDGNKMYKWNGAWTAVPLEKAALGTTIISGGKIVTDLLTASNIKTGTLDASLVTVSNLNAGSITAGTLDASAITISNLSMGGRNLVLASGIGYSSSAYNIIQGTLSQDWVTGRVYTITIKGTVSGNFGLWRDTGSANVFTSMNYDAVRGVYYKTFVCPSPYAGATFFNKFSIYNYPITTPCNAHIEWLKLEKGNIATDWTPAPEDKLSEGVTYAGVEIDATNGFVSTATIGGNTIQTKANATDGFSIYKGAVKMFGVDTDGRVFASSLSNVDIAGYHMTYGYGGSPGLECFSPIAGTSTKFLGISPSITGDIYFFDKNSKNRVQVWVDGTFRITDHNEATRMYLYPDGGIEFKDINGIAVFAAGGGATNAVELTCKANAGMRIGVDSTGPYYVKSGTKTYF